jgi:hypothetical protein
MSRPPILPNRRPAVAAYYFRAQMYTCVPRQIRADMAWMAGHGTDYVCVAVLEQDLFAARENLSLITAEAERAGMRVLAVPARWAGIVAGAPKVPSLFSIQNPETWLRDERGCTATAPGVSGTLSSIHHPATYAFFTATLTEMFTQHPSWAGFVFDEPKCFRIDTSAAAVAVLGEGAPTVAHWRAASAFLGRIAGFAKRRWPEKLTLLFQEARVSPEERAAGAATPNLDFYGVDGRPWGRSADSRMVSGDASQESGKDKILLDGRAEAFIEAARSQPGRRSMVLIENHNLERSMTEPLRRDLPRVLALPADLFCYYYYPRNVAEPGKVMRILGRAFRNLRATRP